MLIPRAIDKGFVPGDTLYKQWKGVMDDRERDEPAYHLQL